MLETVTQVEVHDDNYVYQQPAWIAFTSELSHSQLNLPLVQMQMQDLNQNDDRFFIKFS